MLTIRLQRVGKKNQASFRIVLAEKYRAAKKQVLEVLGHYNPRTKEFGVKNQDRLTYWVAQHAEISPTVRNLLITKGLLSGAKVKAWRPKVKKDATAETAATPAAPGQEKAPTEAPVAETKTETDSLEQPTPPVAN
jgi:small subunit ribosomal protein S16